MPTPTLFVSDETMKASVSFTTSTSSPQTIKTPCLIVPINDGKNLSKTATAVDSALDQRISRLIKSKDFKPALGQTLTLQESNGINGQRVMLVGLGKGSLNEQQFSKVASAIASALGKTPCKEAAITFDGIDTGNRDTNWQARQLARAIATSSYCFDGFKSNKQKPANLTKLTLLRDTRKGAGEIQHQMAIGAAIGSGVNTARELGDLPGNVCTPSYLAKQGQALAKRYDKITCNVLSEKEMDSLGMHSLLSVSAGSAEPAKMIVLHYQGAKKNQQPTVLVGKGVTFDSGGISLKPGAGMDEMKYDMCGAASVLGTFNTLAQLSPDINVTGIIPAVENMPSSTATKPGDIVTSMSGQTIEILNTDAEGRLILCDALTYAARFEPKAVIDIATLTGACVIALGNHASGLFSNSDELADQLLTAGKTANDRVWQLPIWPEYDQQLKSNFADMANIGGRTAGSVTAACFLSRFTGEYQWAHLDVAGTAWLSGAQKGATGRPVGLLVEYLLNNAS